MYRLFYKIITFSFISARDSKTNDIQIFVVFHPSQFEILKNTELEKKKGEFGAIVWKQQGNPSVQATINRRFKLLRRIIVLKTALSRQYVSAFVR